MCAAYACAARRNYVGMCAARLCALLCTSALRCALLLAPLRSCAALRAHARAADRVIASELLPSAMTELLPAALTESSHAGSYYLRALELFHNRTFLERSAPRQIGCFCFLDSQNSFQMSE
ncbi:MAG: hypothetical protein JWN04_4211 [Myxococcaceae bacterium]|nr:hypothetical protein [Myxococcaceae bacterium]